MHEPFWLNLAHPFAEKFGSDYMNMRKIIHHLYKVVRGRKDFSMEYLTQATGYSEEKIAAVIVWLKQQQVFDFEINWTK